MDVFRHVVIQFACLLLVLHNFVPHQHHSDHELVFSSCTPVTDNSFLSFLQSVFHSDIGEGHLDHLLKVDDNTNQNTVLEFDLSKPFIEIAVRSEICQPVSTKQFLRTSDPPVRNLLFSSSIISRGPPAHS